MLAVTRVYSLIYKELLVTHSTSKVSIVATYTHAIAEDMQCSGPPFVKTNVCNVIMIARNNSFHGCAEPKQVTLMCMRCLRQGG